MARLSNQGTPVDIYDEPINHFVATFIGESNISSQVPWLRDHLVEFNGKRFEAVDGGMKPNEPVEVVIRPEDLRITLPEEGKLQVKGWYPALPWGSLRDYRLWWTWKWMDDSLNS